MRDRKVLNKLEYSEFRESEVKTLKKTQGGRIFLLRKELGLSQAYLADKCRWYNPADGTPAQGRVSHYETDKRQLNRVDDRAVLAKVLNTTQTYLLLGEVEGELAGQNKIRLVPLYNWSVLKKMVHKKRNRRKKPPPSEGEVAISHGLSPGIDTFATTVASEAMAPEFTVGDVITVDPARKPVSGDYVVVSVNKKSEPILRQLALKGGVVYYKTMDKQIPVITSPKSAYVYGVVIGKTKAY